MKCLRCKSSRIIKFVDGFGEARIYCEDCRLSISIEAFKAIYFEPNFTWRQK